MAGNSKTRTPSYRRQKRPNGADTAFVEIDGRRHHLGVFDSPASQEKYRRLVAEWLGNNFRLPTPITNITVAELSAAFWRHVERYYRRPDGRPTSEVEAYRQALRPLRELYGSASAAEFGPPALKAVRARAGALYDWGSASMCRLAGAAERGRLRPMAIERIRNDSLMFPEVTVRSGPNPDDQKVVLREFAQGYNDTRANWLGMVEGALAEPAAKLAAANRAAAEIAKAHRLARQGPSEEHAAALQAAKEQASAAFADQQSVTADESRALGHIMVLKDAMARKDVDQAAYSAFQLGMTIQRVGVRPFEPHVARGLKIVEAASAGHTEVHGTKAAKEARWAAYQRDIDAKRRANPHLSHTEAARLVAKAHGVSLRTVFRHARRAPIPSTRK